MAARRRPHCRLLPVRGLPFSFCYASFVLSVHRLHALQLHRDLHIASRPFSGLCACAAAEQAEIAWKGCEFFPLFCLQAVPGSKVPNWLTGNFGEVREPSSNC